MKNLFSTVFALLISLSFCYGQTPKITAKEAFKYEGRRVFARDSVYSGRVLNDSTIIYFLGAPENRKPLTILCSLDSKSKFNQPERHIKTLQKGKISVCGTIILVNNNPFIVVKNYKDVGYEMPLPD